MVSLHRMSTAEVDALIGANLRRLREEAALALPHAAARLRIDPERLAAAEGGAHLAAAELLDAMRVYRCGLDALFDRPAPARLAS